MGKIELADYDLAEPIFIRALNMRFSRSSRVERLRNENKRKPAFIDELKLL